MHRWPCLYCARGGGGRAVAQRRQTALSQRLLGFNQSLQWEFRLMLADLSSSKGAQHLRDVWGCVGVSMCKHASGRVSVCV